MDFFIRYKKILMVAGFFVIVIAMGYFLYSVFFKSMTNPEPTTTPIATSSGPTGGLPTAQTGQGGQIVPGSTGSGNIQNTTSSSTKIDEVASGGITKTVDVTASPSLGATIGNNGNLQFYNKDDGKFYKINENGNIVTLSDKIFHDVQDITWSPVKNKAILEYPDGSKIVYDFSNNKQTTLPSHWKDFSFSPTGNQITMKSIGQDQDNRWLAVVNDDGSQVHGIEPLGDKDETVYPKWSPNNQIVAMFTEGKDFDRQEVYFVGLNNENFKSTIVEGRGFDPQWAPKGDRLLYSVYNSQTASKPNLWIVDAQGDSIGNNRKNLQLETWADKCSFSTGTTLYCAVPNSLPEGAGLFPELAQNTVDSLYQVNTVTGVKKKIAVPEGDYTISNINVTQDGQYLYFNDQQSGKLHKIQLKK